MSEYVGRRITVVSEIVVVALFACIACVCCLICFYAKAHSYVLKMLDIGPVAKCVDCFVFTSQCYTHCGNRYKIRNFEGKLPNKIQFLMSMPQAKLAADRTLHDRLNYKCVV